MAAPQVVSVLPLPSCCLLVKMQGCPRLSDAAPVCQPDRRYCLMRQYTGPAVSLGIGKMMLPLFLTPCFMNCRSVQSRSCPWFVSGVSSPRHADGILKRVHILFGRSFHCQGAGPDCRQSARTRRSWYARAAWRRVEMRLKFGLLTK